MITTIYARDA